MVALIQLRLNIAARIQPISAMVVLILLRLVDGEQLHPLLDDELLHPASPHLPLSRYLSPWCGGRCAVVPSVLGGCFLLRLF
jgi:hypothetical protein